MIENTFCHLSGIGLKTESRLWEASCLTWEDLSRAGEPPLPRLAGAMAGLKHDIDQSAEELARGNVEYFAKKLPTSEQWRLVLDFAGDAVGNGAGGVAGKVAYLDIETTGGQGEDHITTIALYDGARVKTYVYGRNLAQFEIDIHEYPILVTFNGRCFDAPVIERSFNTRLTKAHVDLRFVLKGLGHKGGLKKVEKLVGLDRGEAEGLDGYFAVLLWREFEKTGDERVLETLLAYNVYDVLGLEPLLAFACNEALARTPFAHRSLVAPVESANPFTPDIEVIERLRRRYRL